METNQLAPQTPPPREAPCYLPIRVAYVHAVGADMRDPFIPQMRDFCHEQKVHFTTREYAPRKYSEDCDFIERLPALQMVEGKYHHKTFYPDTRPYQHVEEAVLRHRSRELTKQASKGAWTKKFTSLQDSIANLFRKKTRMEQVEDEKKKAEKAPAGKIVHEPAPTKALPKKPKLLSSINS